MQLTPVVNTALLAAYLPSHRRLLSGDPRQVQARLLRRTLRRNADSWFGRRHGFAGIGSVADFRRAVPLSTWDDYAEPVARIAAGVPGVLTSEPVRLLEPTSGSTAATKLVPYTATLARQFRAGLEPWLFDLYRRHPGVRRGRSYWSATPAVTHPEQAGTLPIGFDDDAEYLGPVASRLVNQVLAVPGSVVRAPTMDEFRRRTGRALLAAADLGLVSVWNPSFFTILLDWMVARADEILPDLPPSRRAAVTDALPRQDWATVWPRLTVVSCWADAHAAGPAAELASRLPQAKLQPKGLLATEAIVTIPLTSANRHVLAVRSHFFEFLAADGSVHLAHELVEGETYEVVVTTGGGLYRYRMGDLVRVTGRTAGLPTLVFLGRDKVSDLVGEKLSEAFAAQCLAEIGVPGFSMLAPRPGPRPCYLWYAEASDPELSHRLDALLRRSFHYDYARRLGQLGPVRLVGTGPDAHQRYLAACVASGQRLGDIKPTALWLGTPLDWA